MAHRLHVCLWAILPIVVAVEPGRILKAAGSRRVAAPIPSATILPEVRDMYLVREIVSCKPGKVRAMIDKFKAISKALEEMDQGPLRLLTDVSGEPFWTVVAEASVERIDDFFRYEAKLMQNQALLETMADYHDLVQVGRREIYRVET